MLPRYDEFRLTESAYRHGFDDEDVADILRGPKLVLRSRRGQHGLYEVFGRNRDGVYLLAVGRVVKYEGWTVLRVFHLNRMTDSERWRFIRSPKRI